MEKVMKGKTPVYIHAKNYEKDLLDSLDQNIADTFKEIHLMADTHIGKSVPIGFVGMLGDKLHPNVVGVDIGCGVSSHVTEGVFDNFKELDKFIKSGIAQTTRERIKGVDIDYQLAMALINSIKAPLTIKQKNYAISQLGTLGGGNHFIEIGKAGNNHFLTVHSGSRSLGYTINKYYNSLLSFDKNKFDKEKKAIINNTVDKTKIGEKLQELNARKHKFFKENLEGELLEQYIYDVKCCGVYASLSRKLIICDILFNFYNSNKPLTGADYLECTHNYISEKGIVHKGSISAEKKAKVIVPINMRDGIIFAYGKGNPKTMNSAPHGAGRILSRSAAKKELELDEFKKQMKGIETYSVSEKTLDEAPDAYRSIEEIKEATKETLEIIHVVKPIYSFKN